MSPPPAPRARRGRPATPGDLGRLTARARRTRWGAGQLQREMDRGVWLGASVSKSILMDKDDSRAVMWSEIVDLVGGARAFSELN